MWTRAAVALALVLGKRIRRGRPFATLSGTILGAFLGAAIGFLVIELIVAGCLFGAILGAVLSAAVFPRPLRALGERASTDGLLSLGEVRQWWACEQDDWIGLTVLWDRAVYAVRDNQTPWQETLGKVLQGENPDLPFGDLVLLDELLCLEVNRDDARLILLVHQADDRVKRQGAEFASIEERDQFLSTLEQHYGQPFARAEREVGFFRAVWGPLTLISLLAVASVGIAYVSSCWIADPPAPPQGKNKPDDLVKLLTWAGPSNILAVGAIGLLPLVAWLCFRIWKRPRVTVFHVPAKCDRV